MCGFAIVIRGATAISLNEIEYAAKKVAFRGPDNTTCRSFSQSFSSEDNGTSEIHCGMFHNRLSIIDHDVNSNQPFEDDNHILIYNGEIYNHAVIRLELQRKYNIRFRTLSDTEVLFYFLKYYGVEKLHELDGIFAFVFLSKVTLELIAARDRFGVKPLYYYDQDGEVIIASEVDSIRYLMSLKPEIDNSGVSQYSMLGYFPAPLTAWKNISSLFQGGTIESDLKRHTTLISSFLALPISGSASFDVKSSNQYTQCLKNNLYDQLQADCPIAMSLSGGIDSSLLASLSQPFARERNITFTSVRFSTASEQARRLDESYKAESFLMSIGLRDRFRPVTVDTESTFLCWKTIYKYLDLPFSDYTILLNMAIAEYCAQHGMPVLISGDGADELHYGYDRYSAFSKRFAEKKKRTKSNLLRFMTKLFQDPRIYRLFISDPALVYLSLLDKSGIHPTLIDDILSSAAFFINKDTLPFSLPCSPRDLDLFSYLSDGMMYKTDRSSMRYGVENRVPYLGLSSSTVALMGLSQSDLDNKKILKDFLNSVAPTYISSSRKQGFSFPIRQWLMKDPWKDFIEALFDDSLAFNQLELSQQLAKQRLHSFFQGDEIQFEYIWSIANLLLWFYEKKMC